MTQIHKIYQDKSLSKAILVQSKINLNQKK